MHLFSTGGNFYLFGYSLYHVYPLVYFHFVKWCICHILWVGTLRKLGLRPWNSILAEIFVHCTYPASVIILCLIVQKLSCC